MRTQSQLQAPRDDTHSHHSSQSCTARAACAGGNPRRRNTEQCGTPDLGLLVRAVETEVIPRLLSAHRGPRPVHRLPSMSDVEELAQHVLDSDTSAAHRQIAVLREDGVGIEAIYLNLLAATARMLGEMWEQDRVNFIDVTVGLCTLHQLLFSLTPDDDSAAASPGGRALFAPVPGESHVFGALIVARFFTRAGWRTWTEFSVDDTLLADLLTNHEFDLVGLSISCDRHTGALAHTISELRRAAPGLKVLIGGHSVDADPGLVERVGADSAAPDPAAAVEIAGRIVDKAAAHV